MAKVYISSTYTDLKKDREAAAQAVRRLGHQTIAMEDYVSSNQRPVDKCLQDVRKCDAYVGIIAWRYGFIPDGYNKSITHLEYETAKKAGIPCLIFLLEENAPWPVNFVATADERIKINQLRNKLKKEHIVSFFKNADQLSGLVGTAVGNLILVSERSFIKFKRPEDLIGMKLGKYVIREKLGRGGKGVVFKVFDRLEEKEKAIKMVPPRIADSPAAFRELKREVNIATAIKHPNVVTVLGLEEYEGLFFIVMEYIEGKSLEQILADRDSKNGKPDESEVIEIMKKLGRGLAETHKSKVIHRDIKPSNVMCTPAGEVKILDFGISYQVTTSMTELVGEHHSTGTWPYMAPEQLSTMYGRENKQVDIWGFGVTMYQMLAGKFPFMNKDQIRHKDDKPYELPGVSARTRHVVMKCLEKDRKKRFQNMQQVLAALDKIGKVKKNPKTKIKEKEKDKDKKEVKDKRPSWLKWGLVAVSIIVLVVFYVILFQKHKDDPVNRTAGKKNVLQFYQEQVLKYAIEAQEKLKKMSELEEKKEEGFKNLLKDVDRYIKISDPKKAREKLNLATKIKKTGETDSREKQIRELEDNQKKYKTYFAAAKNDYKEGDYDNALKNIYKAESIKITTGLKKLKSDIQLKIAEKKKKQFEQQDNSAFKNAENKNTIHAYEEYLEKYPSGKYVNEARAIIEKLKKIQKDIRNVTSKGIKVEKNANGFWEADYGDGIIMVYIPAGIFTMGSNEGEDDEKPSHTVYLDGYWMGKYEVTLAQYKTFISEVIDHSLPSWVSKYSPKEDHPVIGVSWKDAIKYCEWLSNKKGIKFTLPTEAQWEMAASGKYSRKYPWGDNPPTGKNANFADSKLLSKEKVYTWSDKNIDDGYAYTAPVGTYPKGASPYGLLDMAGNVWEWCNDWYDEKYYQSSPGKNPEGPKNGSYRVVRGGSWVDDAGYLRCADRGSAGPSVRGNDVGFRLCQDN